MIMMILKQTKKICYKKICRMIYRKSCLKKNVLLSQPETQMSLLRRRMLSLRCNMQGLDVKNWSLKKKEVKEVSCWLKNKLIRFLRSGIIIVLLRNWNWEHGLKMKWNRKLRLKRKSLRQNGSNSYMLSRSSIEGLRVSLIQWTKTCLKEKLKCLKLIWKK